MTTPITPELARKLMWQAGDLRFKLDDNQIKLRELFLDSKGRIIVWALSRQTGKSYCLCTLALEQCLKKKNTYVKYISPTQRMTKNIILPIMKQLLSDCPKELRPIFKVADGLYEFKNGSQLHVFGADNQRAENIRGTRAHLVLVDEAGFIDDLEYAVNSILIPTTTTTKGKIVLSSTPPVSGEHDFIKFKKRSEYEGNFITRTIYDNPRLSKEDIEELAKAVGGKESIAFRREYLCEFIKDDNKTVVPEFTEQLKKEIIRDWPRPPFFDIYVSMDLGLKDLTVVLFSYYDFRKDKLIIEDEFVINGQKFTTLELARGIKQKESDNFTDPFTAEQKEPYLRVSDNNLIVINDLYHLHGLTFIPTRKDDSDAALNNMRMYISAGKIIINPKCKILIRHLETATWNKSKNDFERTGDNGHADALDALKYLVRNVQFSKNPYPRNYGLNSGDARFIIKKQEEKTSHVIKSILNIKK